MKVGGFRHIFRKFSNAGNIVSRENRESISTRITWKWPVLLKEFRYKKPVRVSENQGVFYLYA